MYVQDQWSDTMTFDDSGIPTYISAADYYVFVVVVFVLIVGLWYLCVQGSVVFDLEEYHA